MKNLCYLAILLLILACNKEDHYETYKDIEVIFNYAEFLENKNQWQQLNVTDYDYTYSSFGFGCFSNKYKVVNNKVTSIEPDSMICIFGMKDRLKYNIDSIFKIIDYRYNNPVIDLVSDTIYWYCYEIDIAYDSIYHFPISFEFKQQGRNMCIEDIGSSQTLTNFIER